MKFRALIIFASVTFALFPIAADAEPVPSRSTSRSNGAAGFGRGLAVIGSDVLVGEPTNDVRSGMLYVYRKAAGKWSEAARIAASDAKQNDGFGAAIARYNNLIIVGALRANENRGAAYIFQRDARGAWSQVAKLSPSDGAPAEGTGAIVAIGADLAVIGSPTQNKQTGAAYVFRRNGTTWVEAGKLVSPEAREQNFFGESVAIVGNRILIGEPGHTERTGAVHIFTLSPNSGNTWSATGKLAPNGLQKNDRYGAPIVQDGAQLLVGAVGFANNSGAVMRFARDAAGDWKEAGRLVAYDGRNNEQFGAAIAAQGSNVWIGVPRSVGFRGAMYHFWRNPSDSMTTTALRMARTDLAGGDAFGASIASDGNVLAASVRNDDFGLGSVVIYEFDKGAWTSSTVLRGADDRIASIKGKKAECTNGKAGEFECSNVEMMSFLSVSDMGGGRGVLLSGIWGWTDEATNREYALVGRMDGTAFVDVTDPTNPRYLGDLPMTPGANASSWREIKTYKNYAFVSSDGAGPHGLQIFDLTKLRDVKKAPVQFEATHVYRKVNSVHNIVINEESGFAYAVGSSSGGETCGGGLHMIDIRNPLDPQFVGCFADAQTGRANTGYSHDALCVTYRGPDKDYQGREVCLGSNETALSIADVTDKKNPKAVSRASYPRVGYVHQGWFSKDLRYFFMNDELDEVSGLAKNTRTLIWDLVDLDDPQMVAEFLSPTEATDHNLYVKGDTMYQSHYKAGVRLVDVSNPLKPVEVGFFDTAPYQPNTAGFAGSWGNYPYFKSGTWIASSMQEGLFVLKPKDNKKPVL